MKNEGRSVDIVIIFGIGKYNDRSVYITVLIFLMVKGQQ